MKYIEVHGKGIRFIALCILIVFICVGVSTFAFAAGDHVYRIWGENRFDTAFAVSNVLAKQDPAESFDSIFVASGKDFPDALTGSYLATVTGGPILMAGNGDDADLIAYINGNLSAVGKEVCKAERIYRAHCCNGVSLDARDLHKAANGITR